MLLSRLQLLALALSPTAAHRKPRLRLGLLVLSVTLSAVVGLGGCAAKPVVYGGGPVAQVDIDDCRRLARQAGAGGPDGGRIARDTALTIAGVEAGIAASASPLTPCGPWKLGTSTRITSISGIERAVGR